MGWIEEERFDFSYRCIYYTPWGETLKMIDVDFFLTVADQSNFITSCETQQKRFYILLQRLALLFLLFPAKSPFFEVTFKLLSRIKQKHFYIFQFQL